MSLSLDSDLGPLRYVAGIGSGLVLVAASELLFYLIGRTPFPDGFLVGLLTSLPFALWLVYGSYRTVTAGVSDRRYWRIVRWTLGGGGVFLVINLGLMLAFPPATGVVVLSWVRWAVAIGSGVGFVIGTFEARAIQRELAAERIRVKQEELQRERDRLEEFASIVSHDLRNPLNVADGHLTLVQQKDDGTFEDHLESIQASLDRMEAIIEETLTLAREGRAVGETSAVDLSEVAEASWDAVDTADAELSIDTDVTVQADADRLHHVFENLFRNAVEHGGDDVTLRVDTLGDARGFSVADDGPGIPEADRERVLEPGHTTQDSGSGFGLTIVEQIATAHGWRLRIDESDAGGARFEFRDVTVES
jgi:signal transduction histidine kinase